MREIGIRKVLGASKGSIFGLVAKNIIAMICISALIASPIAWYLAGKWLDKFVYRINPDWLILFYATAGVFLVSGMSIIWQVIRATNINPVKSIKEER